MRHIMLCHCEPQNTPCMMLQPKTIVFPAGNGKELPGAGLSDKDGQPQKFVATGWFELHQLLRKHLQPRTIQLGKRFTGLADKGMVAALVVVLPRDQQFKNFSGMLCCVCRAAFGRHLKLSSDMVKALLCSSLSLPPMYAHSEAAIWRAPVGGWQQCHRQAGGVLLAFFKPGPVCRQPCRGGV